MTIHWESTCLDGKLLEPKIGVVVVVSTVVKQLSDSFRSSCFFAHLYPPSLAFSQIALDNKQLTTMMYVWERSGLQEKGRIRKDGEETGEFLVWIRFSFDLRAKLFGQAFLSFPHTDYVYHLHVPCFVAVNLFSFWSSKQCFRSFLSPLFPSDSGNNLVVNPCPWTTRGPPYRLPRFLYLTRTLPESNGGCLESQGANNRTNGGSQRTLCVGAWLTRWRSPRGYYPSECLSS